MTIAAPVTLNSSKRMELAAQSSLYSLLKTCTGSTTLMSMVRKTLLALKKFEHIWSNSTICRLIAHSLTISSSWSSMNMFWSLEEKFASLSAVMTSLFKLEWTQEDKKATIHPKLISSGNNGMLGTKRITVTILTIIRVCIKTTLKSACLSVESTLSFLSSKRSCLHISQSSTSF